MTHDMGMLSTTTKHQLVEVNVELVPSSYIFEKVSVGGFSKLFLFKRNQIY